MKTLKLLMLNLRKIIAVKTCLLIVLNTLKITKLTLMHLVVYLLAAQRVKKKCIFIVASNA